MINIDKVCKRIKEILKADAFIKYSYDSILNAMYSMLTTNYTILIQTTTKINYSHGE